MIRFEPGPEACNGYFQISWTPSKIDSKQHLIHACSLEKLNEKLTNIIINLNSKCWKSHIIHLKCNIKLIRELLFSSDIMTLFHFLFD
jgi:hypothetical protein